MTLFLSGVLVHSLWLSLVAAAIVAGVRAAATRNPQLRYAVACIAFFAVPLAAIASRFKSAPIAVDTVVFSWHRWIAAGWSVGVCAQAIPLFFALRQLMRLRRSGERAGGELLRRFDALRETMRVRFYVELRVIPHELAPMAFGLLRPVVVFPLALLLRLPQDEVDAVLLHEIAHLRRLDPWVNAAQIVCESLFFFNPALLWISRQIRAERELCCDALVLASGGGRIEYARALAGMARFFAPATATAATGGDLVVRMEHLAGIAPRRSWAAALAFFLGAAIVFASSGAGQDAIARALAVLENGRWYEREAVVQKLRAMDSRESTAALVRALDDGNWSIRMQAIDALVARGDPNVVPALRRRALRDPNWAVREAAAGAVSALDP